MYNELLHKAIYEIEGRWPAKESEILTTADNCLAYTKFLNERIPQAEQVILNFRNIPLIVNYAIFVIKERWPEAEPIILNNHYESFLYIETILKERWPEFETINLKNNHQLPDYYINKYLTNQRGPHDTNNSNRGRNSN